VPQQGVQRSRKGTNSLLHADVIINQSFAKDDKSKRLTKSNSHFRHLSHASKWHSVLVHLKRSASSGSARWQTWQIGSECDVSFLYATGCSSCIVVEKGCEQSRTHLRQYSKLSLLHQNRVWASPYRRSHASHHHITGLGSTIASSCSCATKSPIQSAHCVPVRDKPFQYIDFSQ
jgi:hypothetical protein